MSGLAEQTRDIGSLEKAGRNTEYHLNHPDPYYAPVWTDIGEANKEHHRVAGWLALGQTEAYCRRRTTLSPRALRALIAYEPFQWLVEQKKHEHAVLVSGLHEKMSKAGAMCVEKLVECIEDGALDGNPEKLLKVGSFFFDRDPSGQFVKQTRRKEERTIHFDGAIIEQIKANAARAALELAPRLKQVENIADAQDSGSVDAPADAARVSEAEPEGEAAYTAFERVERTGPSGEPEAAASGQSVVEGAGEKAGDGCVRPCGGADAQDAGGAS